MKHKTQKQQIMELLSTGKPVPREKLFSISFRFNSYIHELRINGHEIPCTKVQDKWFYTLMEGNNVPADITASIPQA